MTYRYLCSLIGLLLLAGCATSANDNNPRAQAPTDAQVEAYNASVPQEQRIICRSEKPVGTYIPKRVCRLQGDLDATSNLHRDQLRRVLQ